MNKKFLLKYLSMVVLVLAYTWMATFVHEGFHFLVGKTLGLEGTIDLTWAFTGIVHFNDIGTPLQETAIRLAGGLGVALIFFILWRIAEMQRKYSKWKLDNAIAAFTVMISQALYAPIETYYKSLDAVPILVWFLFVATLAIVLPLKFIKPMVIWFGDENGYNKNGKES